MRRFWLFVNTEKPRTEAVAKEIRRHLSALGAEAVTIREDICGSALSGAADCVIVLGGDGTMIRASRVVAGSEIPIVGVNLGHMGYLSAVSSEAEIPEMLRALRDGRFEIEERMMLEGTVCRGASDDCEEAGTQLALNEIVVSRKTSAGPVHFRVLANGVFLNEYKADGIIISTPTGSTAYNLSAGGPIVDPVARMKILTPICPHALNRSSIVLKAEDRLDILIPKRESGVQTVNFDGDVSMELSAGGRVSIRESAMKTRLVRLSGDTFLTQLRRKLSAL